MRYTAINNKEEKWKDIIGFDGDYQVSNYGQVRSMKYGRCRLLKSYLSGSKKKRYCGIDLCKNGKYSKCYVHRLVAIHFINNPKNLPEVNHKDGNKLNNIKWNLNWTDGVGNMKHSREFLGFNQNGENSVNSKLTESDVREIIRKYKTGEYTYKKIAEDYNVHYGHICSIVNRKFWKHLKIA